MLREIPRRSDELDAHLLANAEPVVDAREAEPFLARVVATADDPRGRAIVHLDVVGSSEE